MTPDGATDTTDTGGGRGRGRARAVRLVEVLDVAARLFFERGYAATTTGDIGAELGLLKGSVYYYISSKEELLFEIVEQYHHATREYFERIVASDAGPLEKLHELVRTQTAHTARHLDRSSLFYTEWRVLSPQRQQAIVAERTRHEQAVQEWIRAAQAAGYVPADIDPRIASFGALGMVNSVYRWFRPDGERTAEEVGEEFARLVVSGLATR